MYQADRMLSPLSSGFSSPIIVPFLSVAFEVEFRLVRFPRVVLLVAFRKRLENI
jgi:hypothetical protein